VAHERPGGAQRPGRPNIIFIMTDDHAAHAIGAYGSRVNKTPHLDRLAREGALLTSVFATNSICTPSRAAILTGQYSHLNGVTMFNRFDSSRMTVARLLQQGGYYTGMIGKWHLGSDPVGFDKWEILPGQGTYWDPVFYTATSEKTYTGRYATDVITDLALDFLERRPRDKPFFLMMHHKAPHRPWEPTSEHAAHFAARRIPEPVTFWDGYETRTDALHENEQRVAADLTNRDLKLTPPPGLGPEELTKWLSIKPASVSIDRGGKPVTLTGEALVRWKYQRYMQDYLATLQSVDDSVGRVLAVRGQGGPRQEHHHRVHERPGILPRRPRSLRQAVHVRRIDPDAVSRPVAGRHQARHEARCHRAQYRLRANVPRGRRPAGFARDAGTQPAAGPSRPDAAGLAHLDVLPLLPRPGRPQYEGALRRSHAHAQADLLLEEGSVGALRPDRTIPMSSTTCTASRAGRPDRNPQGRTGEVEAGRAR
jgi:hypothetical protein